MVVNENALIFEQDGAPLTLPYWSLTNEHSVDLVLWNRKEAINYQRLCSNT